MVDPSCIRHIPLFLMVPKSPLNKPRSLNQLSFIPISSPRSIFCGLFCKYRRFF
uniref:Uncharacterized protein n=1 Tax=Myoviridae sp. ct04y17 TaxID=2827652 RepID=A0A8S5SJ56_9CAUD|nr:MAG TPA: hypothetical protein [Myoviridae sp. ct04y17]